MSKLAYFWLFLIIVLVTPVAIMDYFHVKDVINCRDLGGVKVNVNGNTVCTDKTKALENVLY